MSNPWEKGSQPEGKEKNKNALDAEFGELLKGLNLDEAGAAESEQDYQRLVGEMERKIAEAKEKHTKMKAELFVTRWLLENYPAVTGKMPIDELMDFAQEEKQKMEDEIRKNGGEV